MPSSEELLANAAPIRLAVFFLMLTAMALWEWVAPRRSLPVERRRRWPGNLGLLAVDYVVLRIAFPVATVGFAEFVAANGWGLLPLAALPGWLAIVAGVLFLDLVIYFQHVLLHAVPVLWRLHRVHHADLGFDVTTGLRFHPAEILLSMLLKLAAIAALGAPPIAVLLFELILNAAAMFNHGNVRIPTSVDRWLRLLIVTPDMHRVHHSIVRNETNSNFGFNFPWWDRWFGTYRAQPRAGHQAMTIGIEQFRDPVELRLDRVLLQPLRGPASTYPVNRAPDA